MPADPIDATFARIKALVIGRTLHHYYTDKDALLRERVLRRMRAAGRDLANYLALLQGEGAASDAEWSALEAEITIGETFFFRYAEQFAALSDTILPSLLQARAGTRRLRIWSAGCASGAEPYSVAILLHRLLGPALADWAISILGTDISEPALQVARTGDYGDWALRSLSDAERRRDFVEVQPASGQRATRWRLRPAYRAMVRFERRNLMHLIDGPAPSLSDGYDLVLCRNVLIYFHPAQVQALVRRFGESLSPDGWLLLGHAEAGAGPLDGVRQVQVGGAHAYMRTGTAAPPPPAPVAGPVPPRPKRPPAPPPSPMPAPTPAAPPDRMRALADAGRHAEALELCRDQIGRDPLPPGRHFYAALLARALGQEAAAEADFRRAISLDPGFAMAHYHLGLLLTDTGRIEPGRRAIAEAARIARALPDDSVLEGGDGMTAIQLRTLSRLDWLGTGATTP